MSYGADGLNDELREALGGEPINIGAYLSGIKGDWAEYCYTFAFANWKTLLSPCLGCYATVGDMYNDAAADIFNNPWGDYTMEDYEAECTSKEHKVLVTLELHRQIKPALFYDRRHTGSHDRSLRWGIPGTTLLMGDRLEPCDELLDVAAFDALTVFPVRLTFWRPGGIEKTKHRNPLFDRSLGITPMILLVDLLHNLLLGCMQHFATDLLWVMMINGVWAKKTARQEDWIENNVRVMRGDLALWQDRLERSRPHWQSTRIQDIYPEMVGTPAKRFLKLKVVETKYLFYFLAQKINGGAVKDLVHQGGAWAAAADALRALHQRMDELPWKIDEADAQEPLCDHIAPHVHFLCS